MVSEHLTHKQPETKGTDSGQLAEDIAYVTNHAISCAITDTLIQPPVGAFVQEKVEHGRIPKWLSWIKNIFEQHEHNHAHTTHEKKSSFLGNTKHWFLGEAVGDIGAIPLTILVQRYLPGVSKALRNIMEPLAGKYFRKGAKRNAEAWAANHELSPDSAEAKAHEDKLYEHELRRLPLAFIWNAFSFPINILTQKLSGSKASIGTLVLGKMFGSLVSNAMLISGRAITPESFEKLDRANSRNFIAPATKALEKSFGSGKERSGISAEDFNSHANKNWVERSEQPQDINQMTINR